MVIVQLIYARALSIGQAQGSRGAEQFLPAVHLQQSLARALQFGDGFQGGAYKYPFSLPENRVLMEFVMAHPNIAAAQSFHNFGGIILRGPGAIEDIGTYNPADIQIYDAIGKKGEELIPGYKYQVIYKDLYTVYGGEVDWFYGSRGVFTFTNELCDEKTLLCTNHFANSNFLCPFFTSCRA